ncbi:MAG: fibro-slime domain-containing protein [Chitinispirillaceae bacterium]|nr:fibro-slime domain-containing protein [Chitinispirillaceae bacterium]
MDTSITRCGWFKYPYYGIPDSAQVKFMNSLDSTLFSGIGLGDGPFIDLSTVFETSDTAWILPTPHPDGAATVHSSYPGQSLPCNRTLLLATTLRDWDTTHPDVGVGETKRGCGADQSYNEITSGMVRSQLDANGKPVLGNSTCPVDRFNWFTTEMVTGQYTNAMCYNLKLTKNDEGLFEYDTNYFFPADSFRYLDPEGTIPNPRYGGGQDNNGNPHNYYFTMELSAQFDYTKGQTFYFRGDDDVWVFINNRLVVDIGGIHNPCEGAVNLDTLGLTVGNTYSFKGFFVERNCCGSNFRMVTSINLRTTSSLFTTVTVVSPTTKQYDMYEKISKNNLSCDLGETVIDTEKAIVEFYIEGPPFPPEPPTGLPIGTSYGGITIVNNSTVIIDTSTMTGLPPGDYLIRYHLSRDHSQGGTIPFSVTALPPDHLDILVDTIPMDLEKDAVVDSVVIGMLDSSAEAYAVIRDADQTYLNHATDPVWTVRDSTVVTVARSAASPSRCILTKVNEGNTWLVVNHAPGLKPDSVLVIAYVQPPYPIIVSGVMCDNNADLVPDMLYLTLSDTFQTDQRLDSVRIDYRGLTITVPVASVTLRGTQLDVPLPENMGIDGRPEGTAALFMTVSGEVKNNSRAFTDGVSPAIIAADVLESDGSDYDVLFITLSEPIVTGTIIGRQLLLIPQGTADTTALTVIQILAPINDSTFTVQVAPSERDLRVHVGDRLRLIPESDGGTLSDRKKNMPHDLNRSVVIGFRPGAASIAGAWYLDVNADGIIDQLMVKFMRKVEQSEIDTVSVRRNLSSFRIPFSRCTRVSDSIYMIPVGDSIARLNAISTGGPMHVTVGYPAFPGIYRNSTAADSAAPVIVSAMLLPGSLTAADVRDNDILIVTFSEGVARLGRSPFLLSAKKDGQRYSFSLEYLDEEGSASYSYRFKVLSITPSLLFASAGDTIWIDPAAGVSDSGGVAQLNPLNRRVLLQVDWPQAQWNIRISSNPFTRNTPITGQTFGTGVGTAIVLIPTAPVDETRVRATITIYDPVGTVVKQADFTPFNNGFRMVWRGENRKGRYVGSGTYLAFIRVDDGTNRGFIRTMKIGFTQ